MQGQQTTGHAAPARRLRTGLVVLVAGCVALVMGACGPSGEADAIARDACDFLEAMLEGDLSAFVELAALEERINEAAITDAEWERALENQCGDLLDDSGF